MADHAYYCNLTELRADKLDGKSTDDLSAETLEAAAKLAYGKINSALVDHYTVPFTLSADDDVGPPVTIREISDMLTMWYSRVLGKGLSVSTKGPLAALYADAKEWLTAIAARKQSIHGASRTQHMTSSTLGEHRIFDLQDELEHGQDPDQQDRLEDDRD